MLPESWDACVVVAVSRVVTETRLRPGGSIVWREHEREGDGMQSRAEPRHYSKLPRQPPPRGAL